MAAAATVLCRAHLCAIPSTLMPATSDPQLTVQCCLPHQKLLLEFIAGQMAFSGSDGAAAQLLEIFTLMSE